MLNLQCSLLSGMLALPPPHPRHLAPRTRFLAQAHPLPPPLHAAPRSLLDLECFVLSGMLAKDTLCAEMAFMFAERGRGRNRIDYPVRLGGIVRKRRLPQRRD